LSCFVWRDLIFWRKLKEIAESLPRSKKNYSRISLSGTSKSQLDSPA
jgi:hypothetical protein